MTGQELIQAISDAPTYKAKADVILNALHDPEAPAATETYDRAQATTAANAYSTLALIEFMERAMQPQVFQVQEGLVTP